MKERFEPFKELLKALREIKYAIGGKDNNAGGGNGSDIILPKYVFGDFSHQSEITCKVFEIDYSGKFVDIISMGQGEINNLPEEERTNLMQYVLNHTINPASRDYTKGWDNHAQHIYTKEQIDIINENSIIQLYNGVIAKFNDNVVIDIVDLRNGMEQLLNDVQRGEYYSIISKDLYDEINENIEPNR